jgi:hypothetical protein
LLAARENLTPRRRDSQRSAEISSSLRFSAFLCVSAPDPFGFGCSSAALRLCLLASTVIVDEEAAGNLAGKDYYRWLFTNEPEWEEHR